MKIQCILKREGGTIAEIGGMEYHFEPLADGAHVADVENTEHRDRFLAIAEAYRLYDGKLAPKGKPRQVGALTPAPVATPSKAPDYVLDGSSLLPPQFEIGGVTYTQLDIAKRAAGEMSSDEWNELGEDERTAKMEIVLDDLAEAAEDDDRDAGDDDTERAELVAQYEAKFGKKPHGRATIETIKAKLAE